MDVFLSYSSADKKLAEKLRVELEKDGLSVWYDSSDAATPLDWRQRIEKAIRSAHQILVLVGPKNRIDEPQRFTWQVALEAVWQDADKRLIPILLPGAELPPFVRSGTSGQLRVVDVENPREVRAIAQAVIDWIKGRRTQSSTETVRTRNIDRSDDGDRDAALSMIETYATQMIPPGRDPSPPRRGDDGDDR